MKPIGVVTTVPTDAPGTGAAAGSLAVKSCNLVELLGTVSAGAGSLKLLRWFPELGMSGQWRRWLPDRPLYADATADGGEFSGRYELGVISTTHLLLLNDNGLTVDEALAQGTDYR